MAITGANEAWKAKAYVSRGPHGPLRVVSTMEDGPDYVPNHRDSVVRAYALTPRSRLLRARLDSSP